MLKFACLSLALVACGTTDGPQDFGPDANGSCGDLGPSLEGQPCVDDSDCPAQSSGPSCHNDYVCAYRIADGCAAKGHCAVLRTPTCAHETYVCGCDGTAVNVTTCRYADGYASGPTLGFCVTDGGTTD